MLIGKVIKGDGLGKGFGFPTANLDIVDFDYQNKQGVYAGYAFLKGKKYRTAIAILFEPSKFEVHFLDLDNNQDFYGEEIEVELLEKISVIEKFESREKLIEKISEDVDKIKKILK